MPQYIATLRAVYEAADDAEAAFAADQIRENGRSDFDEESENTLDVTQVTSNQLDVTPEETIVHLKKARNLLVKTRIRQCYDLARELDIQIYALEHRLNPAFSMGGYNYADFVDLCEAILVRNETPSV